MTVLLPRIDDTQGLLILEELEECSPNEMKDRYQLKHPDQTFPSYGGVPANDDQLSQIREIVVDAVGEFGFPSSRTAATAPLDQKLARALRDALPITPFAASDRGAWTFLTCCLLPDVAYWRFPGSSVRRFLGDINRNVFRRLWWRVEILGPPQGKDDPIWGVEDVMVQLMERPGLTGSPEVAQSICEVFRARMKGRTISEAESLIRGFLLRVMRRAALTRFELLDEKSRQAVLDEIAEDVFVRP